MVGSLMYLTSTQPDLAYVVSIISRFMSKPTNLHLQPAKRIMRYIKGTLDYGIMYKGTTSGLIGYTDNDYAGNLDDRRSTSGYVFMLGGGIVSWLSKKRTYSYNRQHECSSQAVWLRRITEQLGCSHNEGTVIYCDNSSTIKLTKNPVL
ncbi:secreted RxLR effector protein 161-like [Ricinus communis]|uniref:secreted RxLR effector protein 161-like n=1 Tax=Ricinus communis TaxID=3988 RepID=UPI00201AF751|nr:secreted RxLR effector protein 161-like [Ricinus communis]